MEVVKNQLFSVTLVYLCLFSVDAVDRRESIQDDGNVKNKIMMGEKNKACDDGESNLSIDWDGQPINHTCYHPTTPILPRKLNSTFECETLPPKYSPKHFCMDKLIQYDHSIPTHGDHRPIWPKFGEYLFVPPQRWLHNIEHGAIIMLYHPCAHPFLVNQLRKLVTGCIRKHIITPSTNLSEERPLALVTWGCRLLMSFVDETEVVKFIKEKGLHGPEGTYPKEGQYTNKLIKLATVPTGSSFEDS